MDYYSNCCYPPLCLCSTTEKSWCYRHTGPSINSGTSSVYQRERVLTRALNDTRRERELIDEQRRLEEQRMRNRQKEYSDQVRLQQKTRQFEAEQGRKIIEPTTQVPNTPPPAPRKPVSIYPDN